MFDELKKVKNFKETNDFKILWRKILQRNKIFEESSKSRGVFRTKASIYDGVFLWIFLTASYFHNKGSIIDIRLGYI